MNLRKLKQVESDDAGDGSRLSLKDRLLLCEELIREAEFLNPYSPPQPFVKTFDSFEDYEKWRKKQKNPWLL